ncbi:MULTISPECIES: LysR family transcriptional regulator [unclassified Streptomyces]|uniref:LysR substrate-binding domain-containing protein n=1 Tax=unclassified Streptomyces TaxID=2593676 RepID=UPI001BE5FFBA|nr:MULTISPECIES: LysR family transcriptional regulator [unclassified Streptomyces]MBT2406083.1 LysR family transcriptional regulator [Streptomyces sp. ISL-21]MBT2457771.1 LysR family transcriptional regulator [Streptomyces sp. ISL-86]MBT2610856.1 LysR family transcriptional regulator [Streptomyces sp. ISL-87]
MTLDDLRVFVAVCRAGSLSAVARDLGCTQPAVSQHIRRLEKETGADLLERHARGVVPTEAGRILQAAAADGIAGLDGALRRLGDLVRGDSGTVRVTTGATTVRHFMSEAVVTFRRRHPQVSLEFQTENSSRSCFDALAADDLDLAWITIGGPVRGIELRPVMELPWVLAVGADDPLAARPRIEPADLAGIRHVRLPERSASRAHLDSAFAELGIRIRSDTSVADWDTALLLAELGLGHAVVPALPGWQVPGSGGPLRLLPIPALPPLTVGWAVRRWSALAPLARVFADEVARSCKQRAAGRH